MLIPDNRQGGCTGTLDRAINILSDALINQVPDVNLTLLCTTYSGYKFG